MKQPRHFAAPEVLYEDNHLLIVNKPAMLPTMGVPDDRQSLIQLAKEYIKRKYSKPGNVYLGIVSRLDAPVTGIVVMARTSKAAARLSAQFRDRHVQKIYWSLVTGVPSPREGSCHHWLRKDERHRRVHVTQADLDTAQEARLQYRVLEQVKGDLSLVEVQLETGRKHQIRVQLAAIGHPICGDRKYGSQSAFPDGIALHARRLILEHPVRRQPLEIEAALPASWAQFSKRR
jgi:23S rRNA pseudouridine1911/1915/1917 synthase